MDIRLKELLLRCFFIRKWSCDSFDISVISKEILIKDNRASVRIFVFLLRFECHTKGYDGDWLVECDAWPNDPVADCKQSYEYLKGLLF